MARRPTGQVIEHKRKRGRVFALRFRANGDRHYTTLGSTTEGWNRQRAEDELQNVLADVRRGAWHPAEPPAGPEEPRADPTFHEFASEWVTRHRGEWSARTLEDYLWSLTHHLLPYFASCRLSELDIEMVDTYRAFKVEQGILAPNSINKTLTRLSQILEEATEYGYLNRNPARGKRRRLRGQRPQRSWVEPEQLLALLDGCDQWLRPVVATLAGAGLRVGEACALDWRDVNLGTGTITVRASKTDAGRGRQVDLPLGPLDELAALKARSAHTGPGEPVFVTRRGSRQTRTNVARRLKAAIRRANLKLEEIGIESISERVSPHSLRRTYASVRGALRDDPIYIAEQIGHEDAGFTFRVYQKAVKRLERLDGPHRVALEQALEWASMAAPPKSNGGNVEAARRKREALAALETDPRFRRARPQERAPQGSVEVNFGSWIPGSRGK
jgi:integrase